MTTTAARPMTVGPDRLSEVSASRVQAMPQGSFHVLDARTAGSSGPATSPVTAGSLVIAGVLGSTRAAVSDTCMMGNVLAKLPDNRGSRADVEPALKTLAA